MCATDAFKFASYGTFEIALAIEMVNMRNMFTDCCCWEIWYRMAWDLITWEGTKEMWDIIYCTAVAEAKAEEGYGRTALQTRRREASNTLPR